MKRFRRFRALSDPLLQGRLCLRVSMYWFCCLMAVGSMLGWRIGIDATAHNSTEWLQQFWVRYGLILAVPLLFLPIIWVDCIIYTSRFIGPLRRVRLVVRALARGESVEPIVFRKGDFLHGLDHDLNVVADRLRHPPIAESPVYDETLEEQPVG